VGMDERQIALVENGRVIEFSHGEMSLGERIPGGYVFVDGSGVGDVDRSVMREREMLSQDGIVLLNLVIDQRSGDLKDIEIISRGFMTSTESEELFNDLQARIGKLAKHANGRLQQDVSKLAKSYLYEETKRRPVVFVNVSRN